MQAIRRFDKPTKVGNPWFVPESTKGTRFPSTRVKDDLYPLKSGANNKKLGSRVTKGKWKGMPIFSLTLEERATCPRSCKAWTYCYGNQMPFAKRMVWSAGMRLRVENQLKQLSTSYPFGFVVRLHILGDFINTEYFKMWTKWLDRFQQLHIFGYTARRWGVIHEYASDNWDRFAIRLSGSSGLRGSFITPASDTKNRAITCPAQTGKTACCGTCALCWTTVRPINFLQH